MHEQNKKHIIKGDFKGGSEPHSQETEGRAKQVHPLVPMVVCTVSTSRMISLKAMSCFLMTPTGSSRTGSTTFDVQILRPLL